MHAKWFLMLLIAIALGLTLGCEVSVNDGDDDDDDDDINIGAGFSWSWTIADEATDQALNCEEAGATYTQILITDSANVEHDIQWMCSAGSAETDSWEIATGPATVTAQLLNADKVAISATDPFDFTFESGTLSNDLGAVKFTVNIWDPDTGANASLTWQWRKATGDTVTDPLTDAEPFTQEMCDALGIDYAYLWVWNPETQQWWADPQVAEFDCAASDHPDDDEFWGTEVYSGAHINDFLVAGTYQFFLGFYAEATDTESSDMLLYSFTAGGAEDENPGELTADEEFVTGTNRYFAVFENDVEYEFGVLKIELKWGQEGGTTFDSCADSTVKKMGFVLQNDGWIAAEVPLDDGIDCLDVLGLEEVPILETPYELIVSGLSLDDEVLWNHQCEGELFPEPNVTLEEAVGYTCTIQNQLDV